MLRSSLPLQGASLALLAILLFVVVAPAAQACSQCMCGAPFPADVLGGTVPMQLRFGVEDRYLSKTNALDDEPGEELETEHRVSGFGLWRPNERIAVLARMPYNLKSLEERPLGETAATQTTRGWGDLEAQGLLQLAHLGGRHDAWIALVFGGTAPTGSNDLEDALGNRLEAHLQPGIGAWSGTGGVHGAIRLGFGVADASMMDRVSGTSAHGYRYGNTLLYNAGLVMNEKAGVQAIAQLNGRTAEQDQLEDGRTGANTGGTVLYFAPGVRVRLWQEMTVEAAAQIPVLERLDGIQDEHSTARIALSMGH